MSRKTQSAVPSVSGDEPAQPQTQEAADENAQQPTETAPAEPVAVPEDPATELKPTTPEAPKGPQFEKDWSVTNRERGELIDKGIAGKLTTEERLRLDELQAYADYHLEQTMPPRWPFCVNSPVFHSRGDETPRRYERGEVIQLTSAEAAQLLEAGAVEPDKKEE